MEKEKHKYLYILFFLTQIIILSITLLLLLDIVNIDVFFINEKTLSFTIRSSLFLLFQMFLYKFLLKKGLKPKNIYRVLILISFCIVLDGLGNILGWYDIKSILGPIQYDDILHFILPLVLTFSLSILFSFFLKIKNLTYILSLTTLSFLICIWEIYEYWSDYFFQTTMVGDLHDTILDMTLGIAGGVLAILLLIVFRKE
jgi:hypothetical protein